MTTTAVLWIVGCCGLAALSILTIAWLSRQPRPADKVSDEWIAGHIRERRE